MTKTGILCSFVVTHCTVWSGLTQAMHTVQHTKQQKGEKKNSTLQRDVLNLGSRHTYPLYYAVPRPVLM